MPVKVMKIIITIQLTDQNKMGSRSVLSNREDIKIVEAEEQLNFVFSTLQSSGIADSTLEECFQNGQIISTENKVIFRKICEKEQISVVDDTDGGIKIYIKVNNHDVLVAEWYKPNYILRMDPSNKDRSKKLFIEICLSWWTVFEENNEK